MGSLFTPAQGCPSLLPWCHCSASFHLCLWSHLLMELMAGSLLVLHGALNDPVISAWLCPTFCRSCRAAHCQWEHLPPQQSDNPLCTLKSSKQSWQEIDASDVLVLAAHWMSILQSYFLWKDTSLSPVLSMNYQKMLSCKGSFDALMHLSKLHRVGSTAEWQTLRTLIQMTSQYHWSFPAASQPCFNGWIPVHKCIS